MPDIGVHVTAFRFWVVFFLGLVVLVPLQGGPFRSWAWSAVNVLFLATIMRPAHFLMAAAALVFFFLLLRAIHQPALASIAKVALGLACVSFFAIHKFPGIPGPFGTARSILDAVAFSYVALRMVELLRAVFEGRHPAPGLASTINYLVPFHMLAAGPIQSFEDFAGQPLKRPPLITPEALQYTERIAWGLFKKFVLAAVLDKIFLTGFRVHGWRWVLEAQFFYVWLYLDFSALSDIAVGIGGLLGLATPENFDNPFLARNMINFWERWHISLSQFIRRNLYIPIQLALMRRSSGQFPIWCASIAFTIAFAFCGVWHRGTVRFLLWGLLNAAGLVVTNTYRLYLTRSLGAKGMRKYMANVPIRVAATAITFEFVALSLAFAFSPESA
jgi:D-alanyl-lipoteichoic acid acyltransferase DltB (MBOAT superfamily)